jgi:predicted transglutaminase-like cysteine proteinase
LFLTVLPHPGVARTADVPRHAAGKVFSYAENNHGEAERVYAPPNEAAPAPGPLTAAPGEAAAPADADAGAPPAPANEAAAQAGTNAAATGDAALAPVPPAAVSVNVTAPADAGAAVSPVGESAPAVPAGAGETAERVEPQAVPAKPPVRLIGTVEFRSLIKNLPKWERVMAEEEVRPTFTGDDLDIDNPQLRERWKNLRAKLKDAPLLEKVRGINNFFNQWPYKLDPEAWGVEDYWATPREFLRKSGDCEDYAVTKFYALLNLGVPKEQMRIAAVKDGIRGLGHAVLIVFMDDDAYLLDNLTNLVLSHKKLTHYTPLYSVNKDYMWRHVKPKPGTGK